MELNMFPSFVRGNSQQLSVNNENLNETNLANGGSSDMFAAAKPCQQQQHRGDAKQQQQIDLADPLLFNQYNSGLPAASPLDLSVSFDFPSVFASNSVHLQPFDPSPKAVMTPKQQQQQQQQHQHEQVVVTSPQLGDLNVSAARSFVKARPRSFRARKLNKAGKGTSEPYPTNDAPPSALNVTSASMDDLSDARSPGGDESAASSGSAASTSTSAASAAADSQMLNVVFNDPEEVNELLQARDIKNRRLARKAELARVSRLKRKQQLDSLDREVQRLKTELAETKEKLKSEQEEHIKLKIEVQQKIDSKQFMQGELVADLVIEQERKLNENLADVVAEAKKAASMNPQQLNSLLSEMFKTYKQRLLTGKFHMNSVERSLHPCLPLRFLLWAVSQSEDSFYQDPSGLWKSLFVDRIKLSQQQLNQLAALRKTLLEQRQSEITLVSAFKQFEATFGTFRTQMEGHLEQLQSVLTPAQLASFFVWVDQNDLFVKMMSP